MKIRSSAKTDEPFLREALYHAIHVPAGSETPPREIINDPALSRYVMGWMQRPGDVGFIYEERGEPAGAAWVRLWREGDYGFGFVDIETPELSMSVLPEYRGRGAGTVLLRRLLKECAKQFRAVSLSVSRSNPARKMYERAGFEVHGNPDPDESSITMIKVLWLG